MPLPALADVGHDVARQKPATASDDRKLIPFQAAQTLEGLVDKGLPEGAAS